MAVDGAAYAVVVPAGGTSRRFGSDKLAVLLDRTLAGLPAGAHVVCVGPERPTPGRAGVRWTREEPAGSGPLAAVAAGLAVAGDADVIVLVGGDMPYAGRAVPALLAALTVRPGLAAAVLVDDAGRWQPLASAWARPALVAALAAVGDPAGAPMRLLLDAARPAAVPVPDTWSASFDVDTPADRLPPGG